VSQSFEERIAENEPQIPGRKLSRGAVLPNVAHHATGIAVIGDRKIQDGREFGSCDRRPAVKKVLNAVPKSFQAK
jgi:hypothetical protein